MTRPTFGFATFLYCTWLLWGCSDSGALILTDQVDLGHSDLATGDVSSSIGVGMIACGSQVCGPGQACCNTPGAIACTSASAPSCEASKLFYCDGPEDCGPVEFCLASGQVSSGFLPRSTRCRSADSVGDHV